MSTPRLDPVRYSFSALDGPDPDWHVRRLHWTEGLSETYQLVVELVTDDLDTDTDALLGSAAELLIERGELLRAGHGIIHRVDDLGIATERLAARVHVVPAFHLLRQQVDTRIFQGQTVPEILEAVLQPALSEYERELDLGRLQGQYEARDCCIQFRESTFDFCCRLMEEEGIAYLFEPDDRREKLVLVDDNDVCEEVPLLLDAEVPIITDRPEQADRESLRGFELTRSERINKVVARGFNWKVPGALDEAEPEREDPHHHRTREQYLFDDRRQIVDDPVDDPQATSFTGEGVAQREPLAVRRLQLHQSLTRRISGSSNVTGFAPGLRFTLGEHWRDDLDQHQFLLTRVVHRGQAPEEELGQGADADGPRYANQIECIPIEHPFRPEVSTPKPRVHGAQTAIVMGPPDDTQEDIHTDPHGRIKVRFHWDRLSPADESASCWVRVAQAWAGAGWGSLFIPRVGMEVVVEFLDGNPDRPLVIGCVYNGTQTPPYPLPQEKTKSTLKSDSSPGGGGFNELRFEDAKGSEEVFLHAQKDLNETVLNDHSTTVTANQSNSVGGDQTNSVTGDQTESVGGKQTMSVDKNRKVTITGSQSVQITGAEPEDGVSGSKLDITGDYKVDASNTIEVQAPTHIKLTCGGSTLTMEPGKITLSAGDGSQLVLDANALMHSSDGTQVSLDANALVQSSGNSMVFLDANALTQSSGGSLVLLDANALMSSPASATVTAPTSTLAGAGGSVEAAGAGVTCAGGQVDVSGGMVNISGGMVKIN